MKHRWVCLLFVALALLVHDCTWADDKTKLLPIPDKLVVLSFDDANKSDRVFVAGVLKKYNFGATFYVTEGLGFLKNKKHYTTWQEIRQLHDMGFEIGNHTQHHRSVSGITGEQLKQSVRHIEERCAEHGIPKPTTFCYPGFGHTKEAVTALDEAGFLFARRGVRPEYQDGGQGSRGPAYDPKVDHPLLIPSTGYDGPDWNMDESEVGGKPSTRWQDRRPLLSRSARAGASLGQHEPRGFQGVYAISERRRLHCNSSARSC